MPDFHTLAADIVEILWAIWALFWLICMVGNKRTVYRLPWSQRLPFLLIAAAGYGLGHLFPGQLASLIPTSTATDIVGIAGTAAGLGWAIWARVVLGSNWSGMVTLKENHELIQTGPYAVTRHPIYTGLMLAIPATLLVLTPSVLGVLIFLLLLIAFIIKLRQEERLMLKQFPEAYPLYKSRVKKALVPFIW